MKLHEDLPGGAAQPGVGEHHPPNPEAPAAAHHAKSARGSQLLPAIHDMETFGNPDQQEREHIAKRRSAGTNNGMAVILAFAEPLPASN